MPMLRTKELDTLGKRLRDLREAEGWSQDELCARLKALGAPTAREHISNIEWDRRLPSLRVAQALATVLDTSLDYLVMGRTPAAPPVDDPLWSVISNLPEQQRADILAIAKLMQDIDAKTARQTADLYTRLLLIERDGGPELRRAAEEIVTRRRPV